MGLDSTQLINILIAIIGTVLMFIAGAFLGEFKELRRSVEALNVHMSQVLEKLSHHESRIERLEEKI